MEEIWGAERAEWLVQSADELSLREMLSVQATYQMCWADNAVSFTANVDPDAYSATDVAKSLKKFAGSSRAPRSSRRPASRRLRTSESPNSSTNLLLQKPSLTVSMKSALTAHAPLSER
ncbi:ribonucleoside-triphosphate reductase, adenosylcobalamin-dependent [Mycolicibacterium aichiense]|nr:ribonucleoside-triphosphate reductase, adenosylcobalamin-dependent [Mycolicibacterium aichiense]